MKQPSILARLMGRTTPAPVVSSLALAALNRTLLIEPTHAEAIIGGYLSGGITSADTIMKVERVPTAAPAPDATSAGTIGVMNISGALVNRPMPGASGPGPANYATIREQFDELLNDDSVTAIVMRLETPGGMASGCFDLTDHIFEARGKKPIIALIDDYAFSAGYAMAAACDEIWVSRTGGVGSVGVCGFHEDWSEGNKNIGVKVTAVYAGAHKIDFSQDFPLSDAARASWQEMVDDDYVMFVQTVARYRGLSEDFVRSTEARLYFGPKAVTAGMATHLGTWDDMVAHLGAPGVDPPDAEGDASAVDDEMQATPPADAIAGATGTAVAPITAQQLPTIAATQDTGVDLPLEALSEQDLRCFAQGAVLRAGREAKLPDGVVLAIADTITAVDMVPGRISHAQQVVDLCAAHGNADPIPFVRRHAEVKQVSADLIEAKAAADEALQLRTDIPVNLGRANAPGAWGKTIAKFGGSTK